MSHAPEPDKPRPEHLPERVVENVKGEVRDMHHRLEGAVEQALPRRARRSAGSIAAIILLSFFGLILVVIGGAVWYFARHSEWAAGRLTTLINRSLAERSDLVLEVRDIQGNPFRSVRVIHPVVRYRGDTAPPLLEAPSMTVRYAPWDLAFGRKRSIQLVLDHPVMRLTRRPDGSLRLPVWKSGPKVKRSVRELEVTLAMREGTVHMPEPEDDVTGWNFDARALTGKRNQVVLERMTWLTGPYASRIQEFSGQFSAGDSVLFHVRELRTPDIRFSGNGGWKAGEKRKAVHVEVGRVRWAWLARAFKNKTLDVAGEGRGAADAVFDGRWTGRLAVDGTWGDLPAVASGRFAWQDRSLDLAPVSVRSPAGRYEGTVHYDPAETRLSGHVTDGNPARWRMLGLTDWPAGDLDGRVTLVSRRAAPAGLTLDAKLEPSVLAGWHADQATVSVRAPAAGADTFTVAMLRRGGRVDLAGRIAEGGWRGRWSAVDFPLEEWPDGRASGIRGHLARGSGTVEGRTGGGLFVTGALEGDRSEWLGMTFGSWALDDVKGALLPKPDLTTRARLADVTFLGLHFDTSAVALHLGDNRAELLDVTAVAGDTTLALAGVSSWDGRGHWSLHLDRAEARSPNFHWVAEPPVELAGDPAGVVFERFAARDSLARIEATGRWASPGGRYDFTGHATGLDLARLGMPPELGLAGVADATLRIEGRSGDPRWTLTAETSRPALQGHAADSLSLAIAGRPHAIDVKDVVFRLDGGTLSARGAIEGTRGAWPDTLTGTAVSRWIGTASQWSGQVRADSLPLDRLERIVPAARGWAGRVQGTVDVRGRPARPVLAIEAEARPVTWRNLQAEKIAIRATYEDDRLTVPDLRMTRGSVVSTVSGNMPLHLAFGEPATVPEAPMSWSVHMDHGDLAILPLLVSQIGDARGNLDLVAVIRGTPQKPDISGEAHIRDGEMRMAGREEIVEAISADFHFDRENAVMDRLSAKQGKRGLVGGHGWVDLSGFQVQDYDFRFSLENFTTAETGLYAAEFDTEDSLIVSRGRTPIGGRYLPHIQGTLKVERAVVLFDFANQSETEKLAATTKPLEWTYRIHVLADNNLRWQPPDGDMVFSADLTLEQTIRDLSIFGDVRAIRGTYDFLSNRFTVRKADLNFDDVNGVNPIIDAEATTRVVPSGRATTNQLGEDLLPSGASEESRTVPHTITVRITGRADHPVIAFESVPGDWDQATILRELTVGRFLEGQVALGDPLDNYLTKKINEQLSPLLSKAFLGEVSQWQLERDQGGLVLGRGDVYLTLARQFTPEFLVSYSQRLPGFDRGEADPAAITRGFERDIEAEYRINRFFYITTEVSQRRPLAGTTSTSTTPDFNVNFKARWEY